MVGNDLLNQLREERRRLMPSSEEVVREALRRIGQDLSDPDFVRANFNALLRELFRRTLEVLEEYEEWVDLQLIERALGGDLSRITPEQYRLLRGYFLSVSQSRKQRGGKDFELQVQLLLSHAQIPFKAQTRRERVDLVLPDEQLWQMDRARAVLISLKRTLRERWRQVADELYALRCPNTYLLTAEEHLAAATVREIFQRNIYLVVWDEVKASFGNHRVFGISELIDRLCRVHMPGWG
jgi:hypothetical protein